MAEGSGKVVVNEVEVFLEKGDSILIEPKETFFLGGKSYYHHVL